MRTLYGMTALAASILCWTAAAGATTLTYTDFSSVSGLQLNGAAAALTPNSDATLRLTNTLWQSGSVFSINPIQLQNTSFSTAFSFQISNPQGWSDKDGQGADGITFTIQTKSNSAGGSGGGIGYGGISPSIAIEFDTWDNGWWDANNGNHVALLINGNMNSASTLVPVSPRLNDGAVWYSWIDYNGLTDTLEVRLAREDSTRPTDPLASYTVDLSSILGTNTAYVGFTSGTGAAGGQHDILSWTFQDSYDPIGAPVPEPTTLLLLATGLGGIIAGGSRKKKE